MPTPTTRTLVVRFFDDRWNRICYGGALLAGAVSALVVLWQLPAGRVVPLHYNVYFGIDFLGSRETALALPATVVVLTLFNAAVGFFLWQRDRIPSYFLGFGTLAVALIALVASALTAYLNV